MKTKIREPEVAHHEPTAESTRPRRTLRSLGKLLVGHLSRTRPYKVPAPSQRTEILPAYEQIQPLSYPRPNVKTLRSETVNVGDRQPLLTAEQVNQQLGFDAGADLQAVIDMPRPPAWTVEDYKPMKLYVFYRAPSTGRHAEKTPEYLVMTAGQIQQLQHNAQTGEPPLEAIYRGMLHLSTAPDRTGASQREKIIGRDHWLPGIGDNTGSLENPATQAYYDTISREQVLLSLDQQGDLRIGDLASKNGTEVIYGQSLPETSVTPRPAQDPWAGPASHG